MGKDLTEFKDKLFAAAKARGFEDCEIFYSGSSGFSVKVFNGAVREYKNTEDSGLSFRGTYKGKMGYAYSEKIGDDVIGFLVENAAQNAEIIDSADKETLFGGSGVYGDVSTFDDNLNNFSADKKVQMILDVEKATKDADSRVAAVDYCQLGTNERETLLFNSTGLTLSERANGGLVYSIPRVVGEDGQVKVNGEVWVGKDFSALDTAKLGKEAAKKATDSLGAKSVKSGKYKVIFDGDDCAADFLRAYVSVFSADEAQRGFSLLAGKVGEKIGADCLTIRDDALIDQLPGSRAFDSEGVAAQNKAVVEKGVFKTFLHNRKTAKKDGAESTGNGIRRSYKGSLEVGPTNLYIKAGKLSKTELDEKLGDGLVITGLDGLHSGSNAVSGDFSLGASGFLVEGGKRVRPVEQITIAGNFFQVLKDITAVGSDIRHLGDIASPSFIVSEMSVAGSEQ